MKDLYVVEKTVRIDICLYEEIIYDIQREYFRTLNFQESIFSVLEDYGIQDEIYYIYAPVYHTDTWDMTPDLINSTPDLRNIIKINEKEFRKDGSDKDEPICHLLFDVKFKCLESPTSRIDFTESVDRAARLCTVKITQIDESKEKLINLNQLGESYWRDTGVDENEYRNKGLEKFIDDTYEEYFN